MKFMIITLIALSSCLICVESDSPQRLPSPEELLRRARFLTTLLEGEIKLLRFEGHDLQAEGLTRELEQLITLEVEVRATEVTNISNAVLDRLDTQLDALETRVQTQLEALGKQFVTSNEIEMILRRTRELIDLVADEVKILRQQNRTLEARGLEEEQLRIVELEILIRATQRGSELRRLEELLVQADYRVWELMGGLNATRRRKRDLRDDVISRANELITLANDAIKALNSSANLTASVELIRNVEQRIVGISNALKNATNATVIARLEEDLIYEEFQLVSDLARVGRPVTVNETRFLMLTAAEFLWGKANRTIEELRKENRTLDVQAVENEGRQVGQLVGQVRNATNETQLRQLEERLGEAEFRLYELLSRLGRNPADPQEIRRVLNRAEQLAIRVTIEIRALFLANRSVEAEGLLEEEQALLRLDVQIRDAVTITELRDLEDRLERVEERIIEQLYRLGRIDRLGRLIPNENRPMKRDLKTDVLKRAQELVAIANDAIAYFLSQNRTQAVNLIQRAERLLNESVAALQALNSNNATELGILEGRVLQLEFELAEDLRRLNRPIDANERRDLLITAADGLLQWATASINQLKAQNRSLAITRVEAEVGRISGIVEQLRNASTTQQLDRLERELEEAERRFYEELTALGEPVIRFEEILNLTRKAEDLSVRIVVAVRTLRDQGKILLAEGLQEEERALIHLDAQLRTATTPVQISTYAKYLANAETRVEEELKQLGL